MSVCDGLLTDLGLADLAEACVARRPLSRAELGRIAAARNPLAAASLADRARAAASGVEVTHPWTLRVRAPGLVHGLEDATKVAHEFDAVAGVPATEMEMLGALPPGATLGFAIELVRTLAAARPDLPLRAITAHEVDALAAQERRPRKDVLAALRDAGLATLTWRPGCGRTPAEIDVHRAAHQCGIRTVATVGTSRRDAIDAWLDRLGAWTALAAQSHGFLAAMALPDRTEGASPLEGTSGSDDWTACALVRIAFGDLAPRVSSDWNVTGSKLGATLLSAGADDVVGTQAAAKWAPATDDGPRPLNPDRARKWIVEARRSPVLRDALFRRVDAPCA